MEQTCYNLLFRRFIGLAFEDAAWVPTVFSKHRERLIEHQAVVELLEQLLAVAREKDYRSGEHFSIDGTLIQAWAGQKRPPTSSSLWAQTRAATRKNSSKRVY